MCDHMRMMTAEHERDELWAAGLQEKMWVYKDAVLVPEACLMLQTSCLNPRGESTVVVEAAVAAVAAVAVVAVVAAVSAGTAAEVVGERVRVD